MAEETNQTIYAMMGNPLLGIAGTVVPVVVPYDGTVPKRARLSFSWYSCISYWATDALSMSLLSRNVGGQTKKATAVAMAFMAWATANAIGPQVFISTDAPRYFRAFGTHLDIYTLLYAVLIFLRIYLVRQNAKNG